jgi:hypothetical protein
MAIKTHKRLNFTQPACMHFRKIGGHSLFPKQNVNVLSPNFHIHVSVSDIYIPRIGLPILLQPNRETGPDNVKIADRYLNAGIRNEAAQFHFWKI